MTRHTQVPFRCFDGELTEVDEGMFDILTELNKRGVKTFYSCEGYPFDQPGDEDNHAYVLVNYLTARRLVRLIYSVYRRNRYSPEVMKFLTRLFNGRTEKSIAWYTQNGEYRVFRFDFSKDWEWAPYSIEFDLSNEHRLRLTIRWPDDENHLFLKLLQETPRI